MAEQLARQQMLSTDKEDNYSPISTNLAGCTATLSDPGHALQEELHVKQGCKTCHTQSPKPASFVSHLQQQLKVISDVSQT